MMQLHDIGRSHCRSRIAALAALCLILLVFNGASAAAATTSFSHEMPAGWNLLSTPIALEPGYDRISQVLDPIEGVDIILGYDGHWFIPNDSYVMKPLDALAVKTNRPITALFTPKSSLTTLPTRYLHEGIHLVGPAPAPDNSIFPAMPLDQALISARQTPDGKDGYIMVISPPMNQPGWGYAKGGTVRDLLPFAGYWVVMENPDTLIGFSTTPVQEIPPHQIVWLDYTSEGGHDEIWWMVENDDSVFTAAEYITTEETSLFAVRAYRQGSEIPVWSSQTDLGEGQNIAMSVDAVSGYVAACGNGVDSLGRTLFVVQMLDANTGEVLWTDTYDNGGGWNEAYDVAIQGGRVMAVGTGRNADGSDEWLVRTYDIATGDLIWTDCCSAGGGENAARAAVSSPLGLIAGGYTETVDGRRQSTVRSYNPLNGVVLWYDNYDRGFGYNEVVDLEYQNGYVVAVGRAGVTETDTGLLIRCYDALSGSLLWQENNPTSDSSADNIVLSDDRAFVCGVEPDLYFIRSYDLSSGGMLWEDTFANDGWFNFFTAVDYQDGIVTVAAFNQWISLPALDYMYGLKVRSYDADDGTLIEEEYATGQGLAGWLDILIHKNSIYVAGPLFETTASPALLMSAETTQSVVTTSGRQILVNGDPFYVKGVNYQPSPIGSSNSWGPFGDWFQDYWSSIYNRDIPQIKAMNANTVKTYAITAWAWDDPTKKLISHTKFYNLLADNEMYAVPMVYFTSDLITGYNPSTWQNNEIMQQWLAILAEGKDEPGVLGWCVGNELNPGDSFYPQYWQNYNAIVGIIKTHSPDKITMIGVVDDSMHTPQYADQYMTNLSVWGINSYRGNLNGAFDDLFTTFAAASTKPLLITEWGPPSSTRNSTGSAVLLPDNANATANYIEIHWHDNTYQEGYDSMMENNATCQGGFIFEWTDEWNKIDPPTVHNPSTAQNTNFPGGWWDEEWFGMNGVQVNGRDPANPDPGHPDTLLPRASVDRMTSLWANYP